MVALKSSLLSQSDNTLNGFTFITQDDGLPSDEVYQIIQSKDGFYWIATDNGLVRYDGTNFRIYTTKDGLPANQVYRIAELNDGRIYGESKGANLFCVQDDTILSLPINNILKQSLSDYHRCFSFYLNSDGTFYAGSTNGYFHFNSNGKLLSTSARDLDFIYNSFDSHYLILDDFVLSYNEKTVDNVGSLKNTNSKIIKAHNNSKTGHSPYTDVINDEMFAILNYGEVLIVSGDTLFTSINLPKIPIGLKYAENRLLVGVENGGVYEYELIDHEFILTQNYFNDYSITSFLCDNQGDFWYTTREAGIIYQNKKPVKDIYTTTSFTYISAYFENEAIRVIGFENGDILLPELGVKYNLQVPIFNINEIDGEVCILCRNGIFAFRDSKLQKLDYEFKVEGKAFGHDSSFPLDNDHVLFYTRTGWIVFNYSTNKIIHSNILLKEKYRITDVMDYGSSFLVANTHGFQIFSKNKFRLESEIEFEEQVANIIVEDKFIYAICSDGTVYFIKDYPIKINISNHLVKDVYAAELINRELFISSNLGVHHFIKSTNESQWHFAETIQLNAVRKISSMNNKVYFLTKKTVHEFDTLRQKSPPKILLDEFIVNQKIANPTSILKHDENNIHIKLTVISPPTVQYFLKYKLEGLESEFNYTSETNFNYASLQPGDYSLIVSATHDGFSFSDELKITFTISEPFWSTIWFQILISAILLGALVTIYWIQRKRVTKRHQIKQQLAELKSQALINQLNPHLIFNVLNSIQSLLLKNQVEVANDYLVRFSRFLRQSLKATKMKTINIEEDLQITEVYLSLELLRFGNSLKVEVINEAEYGSFQVPPLIIQPFIENAIKHGIMPMLNNSGKIIIHVKGNNEYIDILIKDNGKGFTNLKELESGDGIRISRERIAVINPKNSIHISRENEYTLVKIHLTNV